MSKQLSLSPCQQRVYHRMLELAVLHFANVSEVGILKPRLYPLIAGPTGAGKSFLVGEVARSMNAHYLPVTFGNWMPQGVRESMGSATGFKILSALSQHPLVVLHIDELDKMREDFESHWSRGVYNDIWNVLDGRLPFDDWARATSSKKQVVDEIRANLNRRLWIVGSGTWQKLFDEKTGQPVRRPLGFGQDAPRPSDAGSGVQASDILASNVIPRELTARFYGELLLLTYPANASETRALLENMGILKLARDVGESLDPASISFHEQGMRVLESLTSSLLLKRLRMQIPGAESDASVLIESLDGFRRTFGRGMSQVSELDPVFMR
jgi:hypothetical protein